MTVLALKLLLAPLLVVASSLAGRRWGPRLAGILVVLPIVAGPILLILYLDHGSEFAANAARAATLGIVPLAAFALIFAYFSIRHGWLVILLASWVTVLVADLALSRIAVAAGIALLLALLALHGSGALLRRMHSPPPPAAANAVVGSAGPSDRYCSAGCATDRVCSVFGSGAYRCVGALSNCPERGMRLHRGAVWSRRRSCITARHRAWAGWLCAVLLSGCCSDQQDECHGSVQSGNSGRSNLRGHPGHAELMIRPGAPRSQQQRSRLGSNP